MDQVATIDERRAFRDGLVAALPLAVPALPIGLLLGVAVRDSAVIDNVAGWLSSILILAGAAQFAAVDLLDRGAGVPAVVAAIFMINARHLMYSAAMVDRFQEAPRWFRWLGSYLLIDQVFALNNDQAPTAPVDRAPGEQRAFYLGSAVPMASVWYVGVGLGIVVGGFIPEAWEIEFAIPLMFLGLLVLSIFNGPGVVAAVIGGAVAVAGRGWPSGSGLLVGAVLGVTVAGLLDYLEIGTGGTQGTPAIEAESDSANGEGRS